MLWGILIALVVLVAAPGVLILIGSARREKAETEAIEETVDDSLKEAFCE